MVFLLYVVVEIFIEVSLFQGTTPTLKKCLVVHLIHVKQKSEVQNESIHYTKTMLFSVCFHCERLIFVLYKSGEQPDIFHGRCGSLE